MRVIPTRDAPDPSEAAAGFGIATAARDVAISVGIVLGLLYLCPILGRIFSSPSWHRGPQHIGPMTTGLRLQAGAASRSAPWSAPGCSPSCPARSWPGTSSSASAFAPMNS